MNKKAFLILLLALTVLLSGCAPKKTDEPVVPPAPVQSEEAKATAAPAEEPANAGASDAPAGSETTEAPLVQTAKEDRVLAEAGDKKILQSDAEKLIPNFVAFDYIADETDYQTVVKYLVQQELLQRKIKELKMDLFTKDEEAAFRGEAETAYQKAIDQYVSFNLSEDTQENREKLKKQAEQYFEGRGMGLDAALKNAKDKASLEKLMAYLGGDYEPTDEEVQEVFRTVGEQYKMAYENNLAAYEQSYAAGNQSWYTPQGYRGILHILLKVDASVLETYQATQAAQEETESMKDAAPSDEAKEQGQATAPPSVENPVSREDAEKAREIVLNTKKDAIDDIYKRLKNGESFQSLIEQYGEDPGMTDENNLKNGYPVNKNSILWDPAFTRGAFSDKMTKPGDVSDPVIGMHGIHILYYLRDIPSGLIMNDDIYQDIAEFLKSRHQGSSLQDAMAKWETEAGVKYNEDVIKQLTEEAQQRIAEEKAAQEAEAPAVSPEAATQAPAATDQP